MRAIFKREIRSVFSSYRAYVFGAIFALLYALISLPYYYMVLYQKIYGYTNLENILTILPFAFALAVPILTVDILRSEREDGTAGFLASLSFSAKEVILGKYFSRLALTVASAVFFALVSLLLGFYNGVDYLTVAANLVGYIFVCNAFLSVDIFIAVVIKKRSAVWAISYLLAALLTVLTQISPYLPYPLQSIIMPISLAGAYTPLNFGLLDLCSFILWGSVSALFIWLSVSFAEREWEMRTGRKAKKSLKRTAAVLVALTVIINAVAYLLPKNITRHDMTSAGSYTLSESTRAYLRSLETDVTLYVLDADGSDKKYEYFLEEVDSCSRKLKIKWTGSEDVPELLSEIGANAEDITPYFIIAKSERRTSFVDSSSMLYYYTENSTLNSLGYSSMSVTEYYEYISLFAQYASTDSEYASQYAQVVQYLLYDTELYFQGEEYLCRVLEYVTIENIPSRYVITGHGETPFSKTVLGYLMSRYASGYGVEYQQLDTAAGAEIPSDAVSLLIFHPQYDISEEEARQYRDYLDGGGQITLISGQNNLSMPNLMSVLNAYGLSATEGEVGEWVEESVDGAVQSVARDAVSVYPNTAHESMSAVEGISVSPIISGANAISFDNTADSTLRLTPVLTTSEKAYVGADKETLAPATVAAAAEREGGAKLLWFTGAESFSYVTIENAEDEDLIYSNCLCVISTMEWVPMNYTSRVEVQEGEPYGSNIVSVSDSGFVWFAAVVAVFALSLAVIGLTVCYRRKRS